MKSILTATLGLTLLGAVPAMASDTPNIYPYPSAQNYCLPGLQPVSLGGVISCGVPNQTITHAQVMAHPAGHHRMHKTSYDCPIGTKGCTYD